MRTVAGLGRFLGFRMLLSNSFMRLLRLLHPLLPPLKLQHLNKPPQRPSGVVRVFIRLFFFDCFRPT